MAASLPNGTVARPSWKLRLLAATFYLGLAPLVRPFGCRRDEAFVRHHASQALAVILALLMTMAGAFVGWLLLTYAILTFRETYESLPSFDLAAPVRDSVPFALAFLIWLLLWFSGLLLALSGSPRVIPLIARITRRPFMYRLAWIGNAFLCAGVLLIMAAAVHASSLTRQDDEPAPVYLLYDDMGVVPRWVFNLGFYRISRAATERWGPGSVVVAPLDEHHLELALQHGRFVFLACHGRDGDIGTSDLLIIAPPLDAPGLDGPNRGLWVGRRDADRHQEPWTGLRKGPSLQLFYNSGCDCGVKAERWENALAPAEVKTFDRLSTVAEHIVWLWYEGPDRVRTIE